MKKNLLLVAALATAMCASAAEPVFGHMDVEALGFVKGDDGKWSEIENPKAGMVLVDNECATLELAFDDTKMKTSGVDKNNYNSYAFNGGEASTVPTGVTGNTNPGGLTDASAPTDGWVYKLTVKKAGKITMLSPLNSNKNYWVYMGLKTPVSYTLGMCIKPAEQEAWGEKIYYTIPGEAPSMKIVNNEETAKYLGKNLKITYQKDADNNKIAAPEGYTFKYDGGEVSDKYLIESVEDLGWKTQMPHLVVNPAATSNPGEGSGFIQFDAPRANAVYYICAQGSKMATNGFIWTESAYPTIAITAKDGSQTINFGDPAGIDNITIGQPALDENAPVYNLKGQVVDKATKGEILIQNGKKFINL